MSAEVFQNYSDGKDADAAFKKALDEAYYYHGHGGYTGTIAEKDGYKLFECPKGVTATRLMDWAENFASVGEKYLAEVPKEHRQLVANMGVVFDDKWGPAVCIPLVGKELKNARRTYCINNNIKRTTRKFFLFGGWASS